MARTDRSAMISPSVILWFHLLSDLDGQKIFFKEKNILKISGRERNTSDSEEDKEEESQEVNSIV